MNNVNIILSENCTGCLSCYNSCPINAISVDCNNNGFCIPKINEKLCTDCGLCLRNCPENSDLFIKRQTDDSFEQKFFAMTLKDKGIKKNSSSGGAFYWIAEYILLNGGIVYGAAFDNVDNAVKHIRVENINQLCLLQNSKYVQSDIGNIYKRIKNDLDAGKTVLFSGTPCQVAGAYSFVGNNENFYSCDILCYGVPSPKVLKAYLDETVGSEKIEQFNMRDKTHGWINYSMLIKTDRSVYLKDKHNDLFHKGFQSQLLYRESCYNCKYRRKERLGDISLGDFWDIKERFGKNSLINDDSGISFIMINTKKGNSLFDKLDKEKVVTEKRNYSENANNFGLGKDMKISADRSVFFNDLDSGYSQAILPYIKFNQKKPPFYLRIYRSFKKMYWFRKIIHKFGIKV